MGHQPKKVGLASDENGLIPDALELALRSQAIKFIYMVPTMYDETALDNAVRTLDKNLKLWTPVKFRAHGGAGVQADNLDKTWRVGKPGWFDNMGWMPSQ